MADRLKRTHWLALLGATALFLEGGAQARDVAGPEPETPTELSLGPTAWSSSGLGAVRGVTIGPIESALHPDRGYGSAAYQRTLVEVKGWGANWVSLTVFGRILDLAPSGVHLTFEKPYREKQKDVERAVRQAHELGLRVLLVPHLWVENGAWRGEIELGSPEAWERWSAGYGDFVATWARVAERADVDMFAVGVELRSWLTTARAPSFVPVLERVRKIYSGLLTYAANWDDVEDTTILGELDLIGINAFFPLAESDGAGPAELLRGGDEVRNKLRALSQRWQKPILFTEFGYTTRRDPAVRPWEWPDSMKDVVVDPEAQADAYAALLGPMLDQDFFAGGFAWRVYADPDDMSQEAEWGFSPRGKPAELVLRDAFSAHWASDGPRPIGAALSRSRAARLGIP